MTMRDDHPLSTRGYGCPGVHIEFEKVLPSPAPAFRSGVPVFVGFVEKIPKPPKGASNIGISSWHTLNRWDLGRFSANFGRPVRHGFLAYGLRGFFENGGAQCFVLPVVLPGEGAKGLDDALQDVFRVGGILDDLEDADLVCVPDAAMAALSRFGGESPKELQCAVLEYCQRMKDRFAILDALPVGHEEVSHARDGAAQAMAAVVNQRLVLCSDAGALYFPWLRVPPLGLQGGFVSPREVPREQGTESCGQYGVSVPPSGHVAGVYARSDDRVGVHKAPANESVEGVVDLGVDLADRDQASLNAAGINCIRSFPGRGIRVWGARTLSQQPAWRYVNVRRLFLTLTRWLEQNMRDLVFEPNAPPLWERVRYRLGAYCYELFRRGALKGASLEQAFFIKCDAETNPLEVREAGRLVAEVGLAAEVPAEFVVVRITQSVAGTHITVPAFVS